MIKLVIFDMDGVLVDACEWHRVSLNNALKEICDHEISIDEHFKHFNGLPTLVKLKKLSDDNIIPNNQMLFKKINDLKQEKTVKLINNFATEKEEKIRLMEFLKQKNIKIGCYTNSIRDTTELMLKKTGILHFFDVIITNQDVKNAKPDPEGYNMCMEILSIKKEECLIIEDSPKGLEAARMSGAIFLKVNSPGDVNIDLIKDKL